LVSLSIQTALRPLKVPTSPRQTGAKAGIIMVRREEKRIHYSSGSYHLVVPIPFVREHGLDRDPRVEVFSNGELLVRPLRKSAKDEKKEAVG